MKSFFERIGTIKKKYRVEFIIDKLTTNMSALKDPIIVQIKRGSHKQQTDAVEFIDQVIEFGKERLVFDPVTMYYDGGAKKYVAKEGEIRIIMVKGDEKKVGGSISFDLSTYLNESDDPEGKRVHIHKKGELLVSKSSKAKFKLNYEIYLKFIRDTNSEADSDLQVMISNKLSQKKPPRKEEYQLVDFKEEKEEKNKGKKEKPKGKDKQYKEELEQAPDEPTPDQEPEQNRKKKKDKEKGLKSKKQPVEPKAMDKNQQQVHNKDKKQKKYQSMSQDEPQQPNPSKSEIRNKQKQGKKQKPGKKRKEAEKEQGSEQDKPVETVSLEDIFKNMTQQPPSKGIDPPKKPSKSQKVEKVSQLTITNNMNNHEESSTQSLKKIKEIIKPKTPKIVASKNLSDKQQFYRQKVLALQKLKLQLQSKNTQMRQVQKDLKSEIKQCEQSSNWNTKNIRATTINQVDEYTRIIKELESKIRETDRENSVEIIKYQELKNKYNQALSTVELDKIESSNEIQEREQEYKKEIYSLESGIKQYKEKESKVTKQLESLKSERDQLNANILKISQSSDAVRERHAQQQLNDEKRKIINALDAASQEGNSDFVDFIEKYLPTQ